MSYSKYMFWSYSNSIMWYRNDNSIQTFFKFETMIKILLNVSDKQAG